MTGDPVDVIYAEKKYAHLGSAYKSCTPTYLSILLSLALVCKVDLLCDLPKEKGGKVTASGRRSIYIHPQRPYLSEYMTHAPLPKVVLKFICTHPDPTAYDFRARLGLWLLLVGVAPGIRHISTCQYYSYRLYFTAVD